MNCEIVRRQTTFWDVRRQDGTVERIHFLGKEEFGFADAHVPSFSIVEEHHVLIDYQFDWHGVYLAGPVANFEDVRDQLELSIEKTLGGWRSATRYFNEYGAERILRSGHGKLLDAPRPLVEVCSEVLDTAGVRFNCLPGRPARWPRRALIAGPNFVVAKSFRVEVAADSS